MAEESSGGVWKIVANFMASLSTSNFFSALTNVTMEDDLKKSLLDGWNSNDWQIRLCYFLLLWTLINLVGILLAWLRYGKSLTNMFYNRPRTSLGRATGQHSTTDSLEDLMVKKIQ